MYITANGIKIYYEVYGCGKPVILLHGNGENCKRFCTLAKKLMKDYKVFAPDSRCHGKSEDTDKISYSLMAEDTARFISALKIEKPALYGFSDGGIIGLSVAANHPEILSKLIISGVNLNPEALNKDFLNRVNAEYEKTKDKRLKMILDEPHITESDLKKITAPVAVLAGEKDIVKKEHTVYIASRIKRGTYKIFSGETHSGYVDNGKIYPVLKEFLN